MDDLVIKAHHICKAYRLYEKNTDRVKEVLDLRHKIYHHVHYALKDISFSVKKGETVGIIGTNGSGKSTLLKVLTGIVTPTEGTVEITGKVSALLELGAGFNPEYTGLENIYLSGTMMHFSQEEMKVKVPQIQKFADIGEFINQPVKNYSSGMFARLAFSVAISVEPDILIVDEALAVGDIYFQNKCFRKFEELRNQGVTIVFVSHDLESIRNMCNRVLWLEQGNMKDFDECAIVCNRYFNYIMRHQNIDNLETDRLSQLQHEPTFDKNSLDFHIANCPKIHTNIDDIVHDKVKILKCGFLNEQKQLVTSVKAKQKVMLFIEAEFYNPMDDIIMGFTISTVKNIKVLSTNTFLQSGKGIHIAKPCKIVSSFEFDMLGLHSGEYIISPAVAQGNQSQHVMLTWIHGATRFQIPSQKNEIAFLNTDYQCRVQMLN